MTDAMGPDGVQDPAAPQFTMPQFTMPQSAAPQSVGNGADNDSDAAPLSLEEQLEAALTLAQTHYDSFLRAKAEADNVRRRAQDDVSRAHKFAIESFAEALLAVHDNLSRALAIQNTSVEAIHEGVSMTLKQLDAAFEKFRVVPENPEKGAKLDPQKHQAVSAVPSELPANSVLEVMQKGYFIADRLLRPALVVVSQGNQ